MSPKEKIYFNGNDKALDFIISLQKEQKDLDDAKKKQAEIHKKVRSLSQTIPEKLRRFKI